MIKAITCIAVVGAALLLAPGAFAAGGTDEKAAKQDPQWNVRVEVLMVAMPQERALALLPYLRDPAEIDGAVTEIMKDIDSKEAALTGYPVVETVDGGWAVAEGVTKLPPDQFSTSDPGREQHINVTRTGTYGIQYS
jgi:hypothetical protein